MAERLKEIFPRTTWVMDQLAYAGERGKNKYGNYTFDLENRRVQIDGKRFAFLYLTVPWVTLALDITSQAVKQVRRTLPQINSR